MTIEHCGGCLCGALRYRIAGEPLRATVCHCTFCQRVTGSAFVAEALFRKDAVEIRGPVKTFDHRSDESGFRITAQFCPTCATTIGMTFERLPKVQAIMIGTLDEPNWPRIQSHIFTRSALHWVRYPLDVELFEGHSLPPRKAP